MEEMALTFLMSCKAAMSNFTEFVLFATILIFNKFLSMILKDKCNN